MHAAVVTEFGKTPEYREYPDPEGGVEVLAAAVHHLARSKANGTHYSSTRDLPLIPGVDGVVRDPDGTLRYVALDDARFGTLAERTVIDPRRSVVLPDDADPVRIAAAMNPAMSSWVALRRRINFTPGQRVLVIGATGVAGRMAVQIAKLLGAGQVIAAGRDEERLKASKADKAITLEHVDEAADVDVVLDYVWGEPSAGAMVPLLTARKDRGSPLAWVQIGSMGGPTAPIPSAALRSARLQIVGSGIGSVPARDFLAELPAIAAAIPDLEVEARAVPLAEVAGHWNERVVFVP